MHMKSSPQLTSAAGVGVLSVLVLSTLRYSCALPTPVAAREVVANTGTLSTSNGNGGELPSLHAAEAAEPHRSLFGTGTSARAF